MIYSSLYSILSIHENTFIEIRNPMFEGSRNCHKLPTCLFLNIIECLIEEKNYYGSDFTNNNNKNFENFEKRNFNPFRIFFTNCARVDNFFT